MDGFYLTRLLLFANQSLRISERAAALPGFLNVILSLTSLLMYLAVIAAIGYHK